MGVVVVQAVYKYQAAAVFPFACTLLTKKKRHHENRVVGTVHTLSARCRHQEDFGLGYIWSHLPVQTPTMLALGVAGGIRQEHFDCPDCQAGFEKGLRFGRASALELEVLHRVCSTDTKKLLTILV